MKNCVSGVPFEECVFSFHNKLYCQRTKDGDWYLCNDCETESLTARVTFHGRSNPIPISSKVVLSGTAAGEWEATVSLLPLECTPFVAGRVKTFGINLETSPAPQAYFDSIAMQARMKCEDELYMMQNYVKDTACANHLEQYMLERDLLSDCVQIGLPYVDVHFPPNLTSIYGTVKNGSIAAAHADNMYWQRATDFVAPAQRNSVRVYGPSSISPSNVNQGMVGNCWFIAALAALAEHPESVRRIFSSPTSTKSSVEDERAVGAYHVTLNHNGWWVTTIVDDYFPRVNFPKRTNYDSRWYFARSEECKTDLWVPLIEKAYAKLHGSYAALSGGESASALQDLTGAPVYHFSKLWRKALTDFDAAESLFNTFLTYKERGYLVNICTGSSVTDGSSCITSSLGSDEAIRKVYWRVGLQSGHGYTIVDVAIFPEDHLCLIKLYDPQCSSGVWKGNWSAGSALWEQYPTAKLICDPFRSSKGTFWMEWKDVQRFFIGGSVCFLQPTWYDYRVRGMFDGVIPEVTLEVTVRKATKVFISLQQVDNRGMDITSPDYQYNHMDITVSTFVDGSYTMQQVLNASGDSDDDEDDDSDIESCCDDMFGYERSAGVFLKLTPECSPYYIIPRSKAPQTPFSERSKYVLSLSTELPVGSDLEINFKEINKNCDVFKNESTFDIGVPSSTCALFQSRDPSETLPETCWGTAFGEKRAYKVGDSDEYSMYSA